MMNTTNKTRGFEKVSFEEFAKTFNINEIDMEELRKAYDNIKLPTRGTSRSAGYDFFAPTSFVIEPNQEIKIATGIKAYMLDDEVLKIFVRSGQGFKFKVQLANTTGIIDSDYYNNEGNEGHMFIKLINRGNKTLEVEQGRGFAQGIFEKYLLVDGDEFEGDSRDGGFGSTDNK